MVQSSSKPIPIFFLASKYTELATLAWMRTSEARNKVILPTLQSNQNSILKNLDIQSSFFAKLLDSKVVGLGLSEPWHETTPRLDQQSSHNCQSSSEKFSVKTEDHTVAAPPLNGRRR